MSYHQRIYNRLRQAGMTEAGALGCLGNWECESNCEPGRVQGDFSSFRSISKGYVNALNIGALNRDAFAKDAKGFGLAQWTYWTRKRELYDYWKQTGGEIDSPELQVDFAVKEFKRDFAQDWQLLTSTNDIYVAVKAVCARFENPAVHNIDARFQAAARIKHDIDLNVEIVITQDNAFEGHVDQQPWEKIPATEYWPPRMIDNGMNGDDVMVLQAILKARGYAVTKVNGQFSSYLDQIVRDFQEGHGLTVDGVVGPMTWAALLNRG